MNAKRIFWPIFRVTYLVCCIVDVTVLVTYFCPPKDGDVARQLIGSYLINTLMVVVAWALIPWPRPELDAPVEKLVRANPKGDLDDICGQQTLEEWLEKRRPHGTVERGAMSLCKPGDQENVRSAAIDFIKLCQQHGLEPEQIIQAGILVVASSISQEAKGDRVYALELAERFMRSLKSALQADRGSGER